MAKAILRKTRESKVRAGHPWIYASEIERVEGECPPGEVIDVQSAKGTFLGRALYNPQSQITLRMITTRDEPVDEAFFRKRLWEAWEYRKRLCDPMSCRLVFSESDFLPGLVVDKFSDVLSMQTLSLAMDLRKTMLAEILMEITGAKGVYERNDVPVRRHEGLPQVKGLLAGEVPERVWMRENGIEFAVDVKNGQKTGFFLDQKQNRRAIKPFCEGARVVDCFCHNGSFSLNAKSYGAREVLGVDISEDAIQVAEENARRNGLDARFEARNCFDLLRELAEAGEKYDLVILDPPAFTKSRAMVESALRGYKEINLRGLKITTPGGFLVTCSCSQHISQEMFQDIVNQAARDAKKRVRLVEYRTQALDHPILPQAPETKYLKCMILQVMD